MVAKIADRVLETSVTTGTGDFTLVGASTGYRSFGSAFASGDVVAYCINDGTNWEVGFGTFTAPSTLARTTVHASSNAGAAVSFPAGAKQVFSTATAASLAESAAASRTVTSLAIVAGVVDIDCALGDYFTLALSANVTSVTFSNLPGAGKGASKWIEIVQGGAFTVAWPASFKWAGGTAGTVSTTPASDELGITTVNNGTTWKASLGKAFA